MLNTLCVLLLVVLPLVAAQNCREVDACATCASTDGCKWCGDGCRNSTEDCAVVACPPVCSERSACDTCADDHCLWCQGETVEIESNCIARGTTCGEHRTPRETCTGPTGDDNTLCLRLGCEDCLHVDGCHFCDGTTEHPERFCTAHADLCPGEEILEHCPEPQTPACNDYDTCRACAHASCEWCREGGGCVTPSAARQDDHVCVERIATEGECEPLVAHCEQYEQCHYCRGVAGCRFCRVMDGGVEHRFCGDCEDANVVDCPDVTGGDDDPADCVECPSFSRRCISLLIDAAYPDGWRAFIEFFLNRLHELLGDTRCEIFWEGPADSDREICDREHPLIGDRTLIRLVCQRDDDHDSIDHFPSTERTELKITASRIGGSDGSAASSLTPDFL